jgi:hypothetical protein
VRDLIVDNHLITSLINTLRVANACPLFLLDLIRLSEKLVVVTLDDCRHLDGSIAIRSTTIIQRACG